MAKPQPKKQHLPRRRGDAENTRAEIFGTLRNGGSGETISGHLVLIRAYSRDPQLRVFSDHGLCKSRRNCAGTGSPVSVFKNSLSCRFSVADKCSGWIAFGPPRKVPSGSPPRS